MDNFLIFMRQCFAKANSKQVEKGVFNQRLFIKLALLEVIFLMFVCLLICAFN